MATEDTFDPRDLYSAFQADADKQFAAFYARLAALRGRTPHDEDWTELYRAIHTVKGGGAILGLTAVTSLADAICKALRRHHGQPAPSAAFWQTLDAAVRTLHETTRAALAGEEIHAESIAAHIQHLSAAH